VNSIQKWLAVGERTVLITVAVGIMLAVACGSGDQGNGPEDVPETPQDSGQVNEIDTTVETPTVEPLRQHTVEIYFPSELGDGLIGEYREIFLTATPEDRAKQIIADLISGPTSPESLRAVPAGTWLKQVYVLQTGVAFLDFSEDLTEGVGGGSMEELLTVYAIVNSVVRNVPEIGAIGLLVNGEQLKTLNGHMDLRRPLHPDYSLILVPTIVRNLNHLQDTHLAAVFSPAGS